MKKLLSFFVFLFLFQISFAQNLVPNPSFEDTLDCPINSNQLNFAIDWQNFGGSPDYFNNCSFNADFSVPFNWGGYQIASSGNAYAAFGTYLSGIYGIPNEREFCGVTLLTPLTINTKYFVSFKVALSINANILANCATNNVGALFSTIPFTWDNPPLRNNFSHINHSNIISDTMGWTTVFGNFIADSSYQYLTIGNFYNDSNTDTLVITNDSLCYFSYYYLDDVCVSTDSLYAINYVTNISQNFTFSNYYIYPNPSDSYVNIRSSNSELYDLRIYNILGEQIFEQLNIHEYEYKINYEYFQSGFLFIQIISNNIPFNFISIKN